MAFTQLEIRNKLKELSVESGGSLVKEVRRHQLSQETKVLFVGLGGMGCKTINAIKKIYETEYEAAPDSVAFIAVDTDTREFEPLSIGSNGGYLKDEEQFKLFSPTAINLLQPGHIPENVKSWLGDIGPQTIDHTGAKKRRQVGRVMLCGTEKYMNLKKKVTEVISEKFKNAPVDIVLTAGIAGGTGSGTFIDVGAMLKGIVNSRNADQKVTRLFGVFYTPDVQKEIPSIRDDDASWRALCSNGYAAMKELDYFTNGTAQNEEPIYEMVPFGATDGAVILKGSIFDANQVFIVSATQYLSDCNAIIHATANNILNLYQMVPAQVDRNGNQIQAQSFMSTICNSAQDMGVWKNNHVAQRASQEKPEDPCGVENTDFPAFMNYSYNSFGYSSLYVPRDELMVYCANKLFAEVAKKWEKAFEIRQNAVDSLLKRFRMWDAEDIYAFLINETFDLDDSKLRIGEDDDKYPQTTGLFLKKIQGADDAVVRAGELAEKQYRDFAAGGAAYAKALAQNVREYFDSKSFLSQHGPYMVITCLSGYSAGGVIGMIERLNDVKREVGEKETLKKQALDKAKQALVEAKTAIVNDNNVSPDELTTFLDVCHAYSRAYFEYLVYNQAIKNILTAVQSQLQQFNSSTFGIYVPIMQTLQKMLNEESLAHGEDALFTKGDNTRVYTLNILQLGAAKNQTTRLEKLFENYLDTNKVEQLVGKFIGSIFDSREKWVSFAKALEAGEDEAVVTKALVEEVRSIFGGFLNPLVDQTLERFVVLVYADQSKLNNICPTGNFDMQALDAIWNDVNLRDEAIASACTEMRGILENKLMVRYQRASVQMLSKKSKYYHMVAPRSLTNVANALATTLGIGAPQFVDDSQGYRAEIKLIVAYRPLSLSMLYNMRTYATEYFRAERNINTAAGRHLDEGAQNWTRYLPELYGVDAENYFDAYEVEDPIPEKDRNGNNDKALYEEIRAAFEDGVKNGYIECVNGRYRLLMIDGFNQELKARIVEKYQALRAADESVKWTKALEKIEQEDNIPRSRWIELRSFVSINSDLVPRETQVPEGDARKLKNIYRIIRGSMDATKLVLQACKTFSDSGFFTDINTVGRIDEAMLLFFKALKKGMLFEKDKVWYCDCYNDQESAVEFFDANPFIWNELDTSMFWVILFSAFYRVVNDEMKEGIEFSFSDSSRVVSPEAQALLTRAQAEIPALESGAYFTKRPMTVRYEMLRKVLNASEFHKNEFYFIPLRFDVNESIHVFAENVKYFREQMEARGL